MTESEFFDSLYQSTSDTFVNYMEMLSLIDIGILEEIDINGRATVLTTKVFKGSPFRLKNVEVIGIGNEHGAITSYSIGCPCLLFVPRTTVADIKEAKINTTSIPFAKEGTKALPISNGRGLKVNACFMQDGTLAINAGKYLLSVSPSQLSLVNENGLSFNITGTDILIRRRTENSGIFTFKQDDSGIFTEYTTKENDVGYSLEMNDSAGTLDLKQFTPGNDSDTVLNSVSLDKEGSLTLSSAHVSLTISKDGDISLVTEGTISVKGSSINFNDGNLEISGNE